MNVFHRYTRQALRENRSRTWVTIVGIIRWPCLPP